MNQSDFSTENKKVFFTVFLGATLANLNPFDRQFARTNESGLPESSYSRLKTEAVTRLHTDTRTLRGARLDHTKNRGSPTDNGREMPR